MGAAHRRRRAVVAGVVIAAVMLGASGCSLDGTQAPGPGDVPAATGAMGVTGSPVPGAGSSNGSGPTGAGPPPSATTGGSATGSTTAGGSAGTPPAASGSPGGSTCVDAVGAQLRERTTVTSTGLVTLLAGGLPCPGVGVWAGTFTLDADPALDPTPRFGARYTGERQLAIRLPAPAGRCGASAVFFSLDADGAGDAGAAALAAASVRADLAGWPPGAADLVPGGVILRGRSSAVLAASVVGDPSRCSPGESVSSPVAAAGDCWTALPSDRPAGAGTPAAGADGSATRFRRTTCGEPHTHEVYWAEGLTTAQYLATGKPARLGAAAWARKRADSVCATRGTSIDLTHDVRRSDLFLEYLWPATLTYPPAAGDAWSKAQVVCLARWQDGKASNRHILHR